MIRLVIVGAGGFGREVRAWAQDSGVKGIGFLDDADPASTEHGDVPFLGTIDHGEIPQEASVVIAVGDPVSRFLIARRLSGRGARLGTVIHPTAYVASSARLGQGVIICPFAMVSTNAVVGDNVAVNTYASIAHDARVGQHAVFSPYSTVNGNTVIGEGTFLGTGAIVTPGVTVGRWCKLNAGAVASRALADGTLAVGSPAKGRVMFAAPS